MADKNERFPENIPGAYYVDSTCIDCDLCRSTAPDSFSRNEKGFSMVHRQPSTPDELEQAEEARVGCPTDSIGNDG